ncbi:MAG TPA: Crp/Fnr family transcriptional regulator [Terriglobales bacterium]|jgi:CRP-like cAMP-binding protein|nr:Crp/Fnr family transcriptional regulator [Terriglobales bacterium]
MKKASVVTLPPGFQSRFFEGLTAPEIKTVLAAARQERISPHQILQQEGDPATRLWVLVTGRATAYRLERGGRKLFLRWGVPGDTFGLATIAREPARYLVTVESAQEGSLLAWDLPSCQALVLRCPSLCQAINSVVANYLDGLIDALGASSFQSAEQRLARMLFVSANQIGRTVYEGIELDLTNEGLAMTSHVSLFTASRKLSKWQDLGILKKRRGKIVLRSLPLLETIANGVGAINRD